MTTLAWKPVDVRIAQAIHRSQVPWIGTRYSAHQREIGCGVSCYALIARILDTLYGRQSPSDPPFINVDVGACDGNTSSLVFWFRREFPLDEVEGTIEPGDLVVMRSISGSSGPDWKGHVMMAGMRQGQAIHALKATGVDWTSFASNVGRVLKIYRPRNKESWAE